MCRNTGAPSSPLPFSQSASTTSNYAVDDSSWSPSSIGSILFGSPSRMNRPVPPGTPYRNQDPVYSTPCHRRVLCCHLRIVVLLQPLHKLSIMTSTDIL
ncbi:hypothetical protein TNIN_179021 [Trichonephila inaurata madagascariensis]|uniref:Uncharacterized protein n=1 Tax=Trichonephila inaurata madagascariensis TaxID=2747483 RepID=A0A8X6XS68_9ARAC|nr:hypothetical protein TNIN_179021 [Trichonephila inaurata madagascariensis]